MNHTLPAPHTAQHRNWRAAVFMIDLLIDWAGEGGEGGRGGREGKQGHKKTGEARCGADADASLVVAQRDLQLRRDLLDEQR
eukprot:3082708-Rhodomonas_salina.3